MAVALEYVKGGSFDRIGGGPYGIKRSRLVRQPFAYHFSTIDLSEND
jgi:hypothetical protein